MKVKFEARPAQSELWQIALVFLKLGTTAFGGPAAHIAMMNDEMVIKRGWIARERFLDLLSAANFIPGPSSTELAIYIGYNRGGWRGLIIAGLCFILPAALIVTALAWAYVEFGSLPAAKNVLYGIKPVIIAIIIQAIWSLGKSAVKNKFLAVIGLAALVANYFGANVLVAIAACGVISVVRLQLKMKSLWAGASGFQLTMPAAHSALGVATLASIAPVTLGKIFLFFLKIGSVLFGSGYVLLAFLRADLVENWHWLTESQLLDAIAVGQFTPGPVFTTATFIGYILAGYKGAVVATLGIFLPAFVFVGFTVSLISKLRKSPLASAALDGLNVGSLVAMTVACLFLAKSAVLDSKTLAILIISGFLLIRYKMNSAWLVLIGGLSGFLVNL